jgi:HlyD family secretion protein
MSAKIFRKVAMDRLSSPEQLDKLMKITSPRGWITLITIILIVSVPLFGESPVSIPIKIETSGVLISSGGSVTVSASQAGTISDIRVKNGDNLAEGDIIAIIGEKNLAVEINRLKETMTILSKLEPDSAWGSLVLPAELERLQTLGLQIQIQQEMVRIAEQELRYAQDRYEPYPVLYEAGAISRAELESELSLWERSVSSHQQQVLELSQQKVRFQSLKLSGLQECQEELDKKKILCFHDYTVIAPVDGKVMNVMVQNGTVVAPGSGIVTVAKTGAGVKELEAVIYVPVSEGKKIREGMEVKIYPSTVTKEEYGYMQGTVSQVPQYPVTRATINTTLGIEALAAALTERGAPLEVRVDLVTDSSSVSGFAWSTRKGAGVNVENGTLCAASVVVESERPISMVIPFLKRNYLPLE